MYLKQKVHVTQSKENQTLPENTKGTSCHVFEEMPELMEP